MKVINIKWDTDGDKEVLKSLPTEVEIPEEMTNPIDEDEISDWLSDQYGFCHYGFEIEGEDEEKFFDCSITITDAGEEETKDIHFLIEANSFTDAVAKVMKDLDI